MLGLHAAFPARPAAAPGAVAAGRAEAQGEAWTFAPRLRLVSRRPTVSGALRENRVTGDLYSPRGVAAGRVPAAILINSSGGVPAYAEQHCARTLAREGVTALVVAGFLPRGVRRTSAWRGEETPCARSPAGPPPACSCLRWRRRARPARRSGGRCGRCSSWSASRRAVRTTWSPACSRSGSPSSSASRCWWRTVRAPTATSPRRGSPAPRRTATRCSTTAPRSGSARRFTATCPLIRCATSRRSTAPPRCPWCWWWKAASRPGTFAAGPRRCGRGRAS